jgi:hypothetical protein
MLSAEERGALAPAGAVSEPRGGGVLFPQSYEESATDAALRALGAILSAVRLPGNE